MFLFGLRPKKKVFLDYASITPVSEEVLVEMEKCQRQTFANPSALYTEALLAKDFALKAKERIAKILNVQKDNLVFTSGGTEGNNLALLGTFEKFKTNSFTPHFITTNIEHSSVLETLKEIERRGGEVTYLPVNTEGFVEGKDVRSVLKENTVLVSVMYANNEIGTIEPIKEIGRAIKDFRQKNKTEMPYFHTDACQAPLYLSLDCLKLGVDMMTLDGIKIYGPRSSGILYLKSGIEIKPVIFGGGQEKGLRSGTENVPALVGLAKALEIAEEKRESESERLSKLRDYAISEILKNFPKATLNGSIENRLPNNINICFPELDAEFAVISLDVHGVCTSYSSSCNTLKEDSSSYVVEALGKKECKESSLRFTMGRETTKSDIDFLVSCLKKIII